MTARFTGWHMAAIMVAFFGVVISVNFLMASDAIRTFGGTVVDNSYVASQQYNVWLAEARAQSSEGWSAKPSVGPDGAIVVAIARGGKPVDGAVVSVAVTHPVGLVTTKTFAFTPIGPGLYRATQPVAPGRWLLHIDAKRDGQDARFEDEIRR
ncbi:MAG: FixH family protein [Pseudomonadota bacterium]